MIHKRKIVYLAGFLFSIAMALTSYVNSSFLEVFMNAYYVSLAYVASSLISILAMFRMPSLLSRFGNRATILSASLLCLLSFLGLSLGNSGSVVFASFVLYVVSYGFIFASLDIFIEDFSKASSIGGIRGMYLLSLNSAWVVAQLFSGSIIAKSSFRGIYIFGAILTILFAFLVWQYLGSFKDPVYRKVPIWNTLKSFIKDRNISKIYLANFILKFFFAWMIIYTPIYLNTIIGFGWSEIGMIFSVMLLPFVILDYPLGRLSDKVGEKKFLSLGFFITGFFTLLIPFIDEPNIFIWMAILFMTRVGAAIIEVMSESYFFKVVKEEDDDKLAFFRNTSALSFIVAPLLAIPILALAPSFKFIYLVLSAILFSGILLSLRLKDVR